MTEGSYFIEATRRKCIIAVIIYFKYNSIYTARTVLVHSVNTGEILTYTVNTVNVISIIMGNTKTNKNAMNCWFNSLWFNEF